MFRIIEKYRKEAQELYLGRIGKEPTWRAAILESIFRPTMTVPGKGPMTHLNPNMKNFNFPPDMYIADWRKYRVEDHPMLVNFQKRCHAAGLHDPWLRNYACQLYPNTMFHRSRMAFITTELTFGFCAALALYLAEKVYDHYFPTTYIHSPEYIEKHGTGEVHH